MIWHIAGFIRGTIYFLLPKKHLMKTKFQSAATPNSKKNSKKNLLLVLSVLFLNNTVFAQPVSNIVKIDTRLCFGTSMIDANVVVFDAAYSNAVDGDDAYKFSNTGENIAIHRGTALLVVEGRQPVAANDIIPFKIWNLRQQTYRLEFVTSNFANSAMIPLLEDNFLHTTTPISRVSITSVDFTVNSNPASAASNRFRIIFTAAAPLPVRFVSITAEKNANGINLNWKVAEQLNVKQYEVERSVDGRQFYKAGIVAAISNTSTALSYQFTDNSNTSVTGFYRIKSVDHDGSVKYSSIVKVNAAAAGGNFTVLSNPVSGNIINLQFKNQPTGIYTIDLINAGAVKVVSRSISYAGGTRNECINLPGTVSSGVYWLRITTALNETETKMIIIENR
jgi:hypothetical protein